MSAKGLPGRFAIPGLPRAAARGGVRMGWPVFLACWAAAAAVALALGRDASWDLRNYHYYNPYALLDGRWDVDLAPAGVHSFLHPGLDLPFYLMTRSPLNAWPRLVAALQAGYAGLLAYLVLAVANLACTGRAGRITPASAVVALFGLTGAASLPEIGSTYNDVQIGALLVGSLLLLLLAAQGGPGAWRRQALAGVLGGGAVGLKLTAIAFPPALAIAALVVAPRGAALRSLALLALGGALGFAVAYLPWGWFLWQRFGNPFGPFFNELFHSPLFTPVSQRDLRFLPAGLGDALTYPFRWAVRSEGLVLEPVFADPRFAVGLTALLLAGSAALWRRLGHPEADAASIARRGVLAFILAGYAIWLATSAILRYALPVEVLLGVPVWAAARALSVRAAAPGVAVVLALCALATDYPEHPREPFFWDREPRGSAAVAVSPVALPPYALVVTLGPAVSFVAPFLAGPGTRFVGSFDPYWAGSPSDPGSHAALVLRAVREHRGPAFVLVEFPDDYDEDAARALGLAFDPASCRPVPNNLTTAVQLCPWPRPGGATPPR